MAVAYPRFHDIYEQAKVHESWGKIDDDHGKTFAATLEKALRSGLPLIQISTWNDWGEGTVIEPSLEFGYRDLEVVQRLRRQFIEPGFRRQTRRPAPAARPLQAAEGRQGPACPDRELDQASHSSLQERACKTAAETLDVDREATGVTTP